MEWFKTWWESLGQPSKYSTHQEMVDFQLDTLKEREIYAETMPPFETLVEESKIKLEKSYKDQNEALKIIISQLLTERRVVQPEDFQRQLSNYEEALRAKCHQKLLGVDEESEIARIVDSKYWKERAKLKAIVFNDLNDSTEEAQAKVEAYIQEQLEKS